MIKCSRQDLLARCQERGYDPIDAAACIVKENEDGTIVVDETHNKYPRSKGGPGTELSKLLKRFGINPTPTCQCRAKAAEMDAWGPDECEKPHRIEEVVAVMREEAKARGLPFLDAAGRLLVRRAIKNVRRNCLASC